MIFPVADGPAQVARAKGVRRPENRGSIGVGAVPVAFEIQPRMQLIDG